MASIPVEVQILLTGKDHASAEFQKIADKYKNLGQNMQKVGGVMSLAVTAPFVLFAKSAIDAASSTEESLNKVRVVFGAASKDIEKFAKDAAKNLGLSNQKALEAAGTFGNLFTAMGIGRPVAADMSKQILTLASDLASFNNMDPTEVLEKLRAGLVGEVEPLRTLGVNLNAARIKAEALALGLMPLTMNMDKIALATNKVDLATANLTKIQKKHGAESLEATKAALALETATKALDKALEGETGELTAAMKAQAAFSLITKDTANAQGDFKNTSEGLANAQRIVKAEMEDLTAEMGQMLLPIMLEGTKILKGVIEKFMGLSPEVKKVILIVVGLLAVLGPLLVVFGTVLTILPAIGIAFALLTGPIGIIVLAIAFLAIQWSQNMGGIQEKTRVAVAFMSDVFEGFQMFVLQVWRAILGGISIVVNGILGKLNDFINIYNALAEKLGLPLIGKIEVLTPNLAAVDAAIASVARARTARLTVAVGYIDPGPPGLGRSFQHGTPFVPFTGPAFVHRGERIIPAHQNRPGAGSGGDHEHPIVINLNGHEIATVVGGVFTQQRRSQGLA